jgi:hypothetical protein
VDKDLKEYKDNSRDALINRINEKHIKWTQRIKEYILTLPEGDEKNNLTRLVNEIESR